MKTLKLLRMDKKICNSVYHITNLFDYVSSVCLQ